jgi:acylphosphatase
MRRVRVRVSGRVQGVFFRATCVERAREAGVAGWVRNLADGRVEAVFEGADDDVEAMLAWCRIGTSMARVTGVETIDEDPRGETGFALRGRS